QNYIPRLLLASRFGKTLRFPRATFQLPQKKPTSSGIFSCCFSRWSLRVFSYAREVFHSTYIHLCSRYYGGCLERRTVDSWSTKYATSCGAADTSTSCTSRE